MSLAYKDVAKPHSVFKQWQKQWCYLSRYAQCAIACAWRLGTIKIIVDI